MAAIEKQLESMVYRLKQERGRWPFLTPRLENATDKTRENAPPLVKQIWGFFEEQLKMAESREMTVARFVTAANEVNIGGFWMEHAKGELRTRKDHEILKFLSPCWEKEFMAGVFSARYHFRGLCAINIEHAHKPFAGPVPGLPEVSVYHGSSVYVQSGCRDTALRWVPGTGSPNLW